MANFVIRNGREWPQIIPLGPAGGTPFVFVFRPGGVEVGNVYTTWVSLMAAVGQAQGRRIIQFDTSLDACVVPAGTWDMTNVEWSGDISNAQQISVDEGAVFTKLRVITNSLQVTFTGSTPPVTDMEDFETFLIQYGSELACSGSGPFIRNSTPAVNAVIVLLFSARLVFEDTPVIDLAAINANAFVIAVNLGTVEGDTISGIAGSTLIAFIASSSAIFDENQPSFAGSFIPFNDTRARFDPTMAPIVSSQSVEANWVARYDPSGGTFTLTLPSAFNARGMQILFKNVTANATAITVAASGVDTIDGAASVLLTGARVSLFLVSDGVSEWMAI